MRLRPVLAGGVLALLALAPLARAQLLRGGLGSLTSAGPLGPIAPLARPLQDAAAAATPEALAEARKNRLDALVRAHPESLEFDERGHAVLRDEVLALAPSDAALAEAEAGGFEVVSEEPILEGGEEVAVLRTPPIADAREGLRRLRRLDPRGTYDYDPLFEPSGSLAPPVAASARGAASSPGAAQGLVIGLVDTGVDEAPSVFQRGQVASKAFAPDGFRPQPHGTEVASLLVGSAAGFRSSAPGARLLAADVYGGGETGGAADMVVRGLAWTVRNGARVVNVSLVGPDNLVLRAAVQSLVRQGVLIVAPVGNDGPAAPPAYPASYPGVVAVTGVDGRGRPLIEAGRALHVDFAAPGADLAAAAPGGVFRSVRGTSFAAPLVAGLLASAYAARGDAAGAVSDLARAARPGRDLGRGLVAMDLRTPPEAVRGPLQAR